MIVIVGAELHHVFICILIKGNIYYIILVIIVVDDNSKVSNTVSPSKPQSLVEGDGGGAGKSLETSKSGFCVDSFLSGAHATSSPLRID